MSFQVYECQLTGSYRPRKSRPRCTRCSILIDLDSRYNVSRCHYTVDGTAKMYFCSTECHKEYMGNDEPELMFGELLDEGHRMMEGVGGWYS